MCICLPDVTISAHRALYEAVVDFYEEERRNGGNEEDDLYLPDSDYGQIHRLVELWNCFVNVCFGVEID